jgi:hypothetical protein
MLIIDKILQYKNYIIAGIVLIAIIVAYNVFSGSNLPNNGTTANTVRSELGTAISQQSEAIRTVKSVETGLGNSVKSVSGIESTVSHVAGTNATSITTATDSAELIKDCQRILSEVRTRGKSGK